MYRALMISLTVLMCGCGVEVLTTTAIQGELAAQQAQTLKKTMDWAKESTSETQARHAIDLFRAETGRYPASLNELIPEFLPSLPAHPDGTPYGYDPATGALLDKPIDQPVAVAPAPLSPEDQQRKMQIANAIAMYAQETRLYPPSLAALVPNYLNYVPKTASGQDFIYYPQTGFVCHPSELAALQTPTAPAQQPAAVQGRAPGVGGGGLMGETMTGIGIQQQLGNMSNAGSSSAGSRAREGVGNTTGNYSQQQERTLDSMGF